MERKLTIEITTSDPTWDTDRLNRYGWQYVELMQVDTMNSPAVFTPEVYVGFVDGDS